MKRNKQCYIVVITQTAAQAVAMILSLAWIFPASENPLLIMVAKELLASPPPGPWMGAALALCVLRIIPVIVPIVSPVTYRDLMMVPRLMSCPALLFVEDSLQIQNYSH